MIKGVSSCSENLFMEKKINFSIDKVGDYFSIWRNFFLYIEIFSKGDGAG